MEDYKERMAEEYRQLAERMVKLQNILTKNSKGELEFELSCPVDLLERQLKVMKEYMSVLEERAQIENVALTFDTRGE